MLMEHPLELKINSVPTQSGIIERETSIVELVHPGDSFDNYEVFCRHLGLKAKAGNSRSAQVDKIKRQIDYHVEGKRKIVIDGVFDTPKEKPMRASNSRLKDMDKLICHRLYNGKLDDYVTYSRFATILGLVNNSYPQFRYGDIIFQDDVSFDPHKGIYRDADAVFRLPEGRYKRVWRILIESLINKLHQSYRSSIDCALKHLKHDGYIKFEEDTLARLHNSSVRIATLDEIMLDFEREQAALEAVSCANLNEVYRKGRFHQYRTEKKKRCSAYDNFDYLFPAVRITPEKQMDLSHFDAKTTYRKMSMQFFRNALKWKSVKSDKKMIFLLNRMLLHKPIWDYEMFELLWEANMPRGITEAEWYKYLSWLADRETCKLPDFM